MPRLRSVPRSPKKSSLLSHREFSDNQAKELKRIRTRIIASMQGKAEEMSVGSIETETTAGILEVGTDQLPEIEAAIDRCKGGLYGICMGCTELIPKERLKAIPYALRCKNCQASFEVDGPSDREVGRALPVEKYPAETEDARSTGRVDR